MYQLIIVVHVLLGLAVVGLILMQQGKGADAGAAFGSGSSGSVFGAQGAASFLSRTTAILATLFFSTSLGLAILAGHQGRAKDLMDTTEVEQKAPDVPGIAANREPSPVPASNVPAVDVPAVVTDEATKVNDTAISPEKSSTVDNETKVDDNKSESVAEAKKQLANQKAEPDSKPSETKADKSDNEHAEKTAVKK
jgi:preprotein translocase subunit SecG